MTLEGLLFM